ncbi:MAG: hypothetical protein ACRDAO_05915 [Culicoidibacterales bacterium]
MYKKSNQKIYYQNVPLEIDFLIKTDVVWLSEQPWGYKWSEDPFEELRLNPLNACANMKYKTGNNNQFRGCAFCQRMYDAKRCEEAVGITRIEDIISDIQLNMGKDSIEKTKKLLF